MKRLFLVTLALLSLAASNTDYMTTTMRTPVVSGAATIFSKAPTIAYEAAGAAVNTTTVTLGASASGTLDDAYDGLQLSARGSGSCSVNNNYVGTITDYASSTKRATITPASTSAIDPNCTVEVGPQIPQTYKQVCFGNAAGTLKISTRVGGTAAEDYFTLSASQWYCINSGSPIPINQLEILPVSATDTVQKVIF